MRNELNLYKNRSFMKLIVDTTNPKKRLLNLLITSEIPYYLAHNKPMLLVLPNNISNHKNIGNIFFFEY